MSNGKRWSEISRITPGRTENGVKNRFNSLLKRWVKMHNLQEKLEEETIIAEICKEIQSNIETKEQDSKKTDNENSLLLKSPKKAIHIEELKKNQGINLLFELLKSDLTNKTGNPSNICQINSPLHHVKPDFSEFEHEKQKKIHKESFSTTDGEHFCNLKKEEKEVNVYHATAVNPGIYANMMGFNTGFNNFLMQQYTMNMMLQQAYVKTVINSFMKQETSH